MTATAVRPREATAKRLLAASARHRLDPDVDIDWTADQPPGVFYCAPQRCSLYGTPLWDGLSREQQVALSRLEVASIASVGIWFESILMQMLLRDAYHRDAATAHVRYAYTEVAEECRHSAMFARMIAALGAVDRGPGRLPHLLGRVFKATARGPLAFAGTLYVEELLDALQREAAADASLQPLVRQVSRLHVVEEARHIRYARDELARTVPRLRRHQLAWVRLGLAAVAYVATTRLVHPAVYAEVGLDPRTARSAARRNPHWLTTRRFATARVMALLDELGLVAGPGRLLWRAAGLR